jgi:hypothetical protein
LWVHKPILHVPSIHPFIYPSIHPSIHPTVNCYIVHGNRLISWGTESAGSIVVLQELCRS